MRFVPVKEYRETMQLTRQAFWARKSRGKVKTVVAPAEVLTECVVLTDQEYEIYQAL